ncbi:MAG TPA: polyprenol monophosphomannose synthase, partial [Candidatus Omnitrophota bacterium]|nr:polyprenol monophosphomannose synthase [Candidatus Omnitrophota bacterium]
AIEILVVDDNSPDGTGKIVAEWSERETRIHLLAREKKMGLGPAYIAGFKWGLERDYELFIEMDADLSHRPRYLADFLKKIKQCDMVVGSRWMKGGRVANWPLSRVLLSSFAGLYCRLILGVHVADMTAGYVSYRRRVLESIPLEDVKADGYCFQIEMKYRVLQKGFKVIETPILFTDRRVGKSKISRSIVYEAFFKVWWLRFNRNRFRMN